MLGAATLGGILVAGLVMPAVVLVNGLTTNVARSVAEFPQELRFEPLDERSRLLTADGDVLADIYDVNRVVVPFSEISRPMVKSILAIEDHRFFLHGPMDLTGTSRAFVRNLLTGATTQGGSSITQQLVKLTLIEQAATEAERKAALEDSYARKIRELRYAIAVENKYSKQWILERYLNLAYFGDGAYGIQAAARHYFSVDAKDLNVLQGATLAGLVKNPVGYTPTVHRQAAKERRNVVLGRLHQLGVISKRAYRRAVSQPLQLRVEKTPNGCASSIAPFFCDYVVASLRSDPSLGPSDAQRLARLRTGGLTIRTTLRLPHQQSATSAVMGHVYPTDPAIGAVAMVEPKTGDVTALAQSRSMGSRDGETYLNHLVPESRGGTGGFQAGSTFKAFVLATAVEQGVALNAPFPSPNEATYDQSDYANCPGSPPFVGDFTVRNMAVPSDGVETLYTATRRSINTFFLRVEQETGVCAPYELAQSMGVELTSPTGSESGQAERVPMFTLGVADASPLEMAEAYATFAARGLHCSSRPYTSWTVGGELTKNEPNCSRVMTAATADAVNDVLRGVMEPGGYGAPFALDAPSAAKTGNNEGSSIWFVGYTPTLAAASVIAGVDPTGSPASLVGRTVGGITFWNPSAASYAAPLWGEAMGGVPHDPDQSFVFPYSVAGAGQVAVPSRAVSSESGRQSAG